MALERVVEVEFAAGQYERLEKIARARGQPVTALIREAVEKEYLEPDLAGKCRAVEQLLLIDIPTGGWEEAKEEISKARSRDIEAP